MLAANSPLLAWRDPVYILAGLAGILAMVALVVQPLLAIGAMPSLSSAQGRRLHRWVGAGVMGLIILHVGALWITSPPDVIDALTFQSPTRFSLWGVMAMWAVFLTGLLAYLRPKLRLRPLVWKRMHGAFAVVIAGGSILHALLIDGTMEPISKALLCAALGYTTFLAVQGLIRQNTRG